MQAEAQKTDIEKILAAFNLFAPYLKELFEDDVTLSVTDKEKYLKILHSASIKVSVNDGDRRRPVRLPCRLLCREKPDRW